VDTAARPSAFAEWVFCYTKGNLMPTQQGETPILVDHERGERCRLGMVDHREIERIWRRISLQIVGSSSDYEVRFADNDETRDIVFEIPSLQIGGRPLRGRPDLVLRNKRNGHIIIVERKTTRQHRVIEQLWEKRNWKNIEAQLWCYSYIKDWADHQSVTLFGELWRNHESTLTPVPTPLVWSKDDADHDDECRAFFGGYCTWVRDQPR
jgi:hypothetical protein